MVLLIALWENHGLIYTTGSGIYDGLNLASNWPMDKVNDIIAASFMYIQNVEVGDLSLLVVCYVDKLHIQGQANILSHIAFI